MSKKNIEQYIPKAMEVLERIFKNKKDSEGNILIPSSYNGYISSFGASVIQSGLLSTIALFENQNANTQEKKELLTNLILQILDNTKGENDTLLEYVLKNGKDSLKQQILDISIAIKLSIRTFKLDKGKKNE